MKLILAMIFCFHFTLAAEKMNCFDSDGGQDADVAAKIIYRIWDPLCRVEENIQGQKESCLSQIVVDKDMCKDKNTLIEQFCDPQLGPSIHEFKCQCDKGACVK